MKISIAEWMVIVDTLRDSLVIGDAAHDSPLFNYTHETRKQLSDTLLARLNEECTTVSANEVQS